MNNAFELVNYNKLNTLTKLKLAIAQVKTQVKNLELFDSKELSSIVYSTLLKNGVDAKIISTYNLGYELDYYFTMVPKDNHNYYIIDLCAGIMQLNDSLRDLQTSGIKSVGDAGFKQYLQDITKEKYGFEINQVYSKNIKKR